VYGLHRNLVEGSVDVQNTCHANEPVSRVGLDVQCKKLLGSCKTEAETRL
jgi:hypothetical protein